MWPEPLGSCMAGLDSGTTQHPLQSFGLNCWGTSVWQATSSESCSGDIYHGVRISVTMVVISSMTCLKHNITKYTSEVDVACLDSPNCHASCTRQSYWSVKATSFALYSRASSSTHLPSNSFGTFSLGLKRPILENPSNVEAWSFFVLRKSAKSGFGDRNLVLQSGICGLCSTV